MVRVKKRNDIENIISERPIFTKLYYSPYQIDLWMGEG